MRSKIRLKHYSIRMEHAYVDFKCYILHFEKAHPNNLGAADVEPFLTYLMVVSKVSASIQAKLKVRYYFCII